MNDSDRELNNLEKHLKNMALFNALNALQATRKQILQLEDALEKSRAQNAATLTEQDAKLSEELKNEYIFSVGDNNDYTWHENIQDAIDEFLEDYHVDDVKHILYMGTVRSFTHSGLLDVKSDIIENMQNRAYEEVGDYADAYLEDIPKEKIADLSRVVAEWLDANVPQPAFTVTDDIVEIEIEFDSDGKYVSHREVVCPKN